MHDLEQKFFEEVGRRSKLKQERLLKKFNVIAMDAITVFVLAAIFVLASKAIFHVR
jgi:hypothetical protein